MPIFEYNCPSCGLIEVLLMPGEKELKFCPECEEKGKKNKITKALSASALSFKGSGFYITDYTSKGSSSSEGGSESKSKGSDTQKAESKPAETSAPAAKTEKKSESKKKKDA